MPVNWKMVEGSGKSMVSRSIVVSQSMVARVCLVGHGENARGCRGRSLAQPCTGSYAGCGDITSPYFSHPLLPD